MRSRSSTRARLSRRRGWTILFESLGFEPKEGKKLVFDLAIDNSADGTRRDRQLVWNGKARNSADRMP
jgi:hypothetical protein